MTTWHQLKRDGRILEQHSTAEACAAAAAERGLVVRVAGRPAPELADGVEIVETDIPDERF